jgi:DNA-binding response OmpR family regulator
MTLIGAVLKDYLMLNDFDVTYKNGMEGFENSRKTPTIYVLDVMMPYKDGCTLAKEIREKIAKYQLSFSPQNL